METREVEWGVGKRNDQFRVKFITDCVFVFSHPIAISF